MGASHAALGWGLTLEFRLQPARMPIRTHSPEDKIKLVLMASTLPTTQHLRTYCLLLRDVIK